MTFINQKKTFLEKLDRSKKGSIDKKVMSLIKTINSLNDYYTTSSCSGRVYFWIGSGKKNETAWLRVSHDLIKEDFFKLESLEFERDGLVWLRYEGFIIHIACKDIDSAKHLLEKAKNIYKKSSILTISNKIIIEIRNSNLIEMPFYNEGKIIFSGDEEWLKNKLNDNFKQNWDNINKFEKSLLKNF